jgi:ankyrin repeat protein
MKLLEAKPDLITRRNRLNETALRFLAVENYPNGVEFLCDHGAEVNSTDFSEATPLLHAASLGYEEIVRILLTHGANPNVQDNTGETPLSSAKRSGNQQIVEMLIGAGARGSP